MSTMLRRSKLAAAVVLIGAAWRVQAQGLAGTPDQRAKQLAIEKAAPQMPITEDVLYLSVPGQTMGQTVGVSKNSKGHLFVYSRTGPSGTATSLKNGTCSAVAPGVAAV